MKKGIMIILMVLVFGMYTNVFAIDACTTSEMNRLNELANNVTFKTNYDITSVDEENKSIVVIYNIEIMNFDQDLKIHYNSASGQFENEMVITSDTNKIDNLFDGDTITFKIYSYTTNLCTDEILKTKTVTLPKLNTYYYFNKEKCDAHPDFKYCKEFMDTESLDFDIADKEFEEYLNPSVGDIVKDLKENNTILLYGIIGLVLVVGIGTVVFIVIKKRKKDDL